MPPEKCFSRRRYCVHSHAFFLGSGIAFFHRHVCVSGANWVLSDIELGPRICVDQGCQICFFSSADCSFVPTVSLLENDNSQPVAGCILPHTNHVFVPNMLCPTQPVAGCAFPHKHVFLPNMFFQPIRSFVPAVSLLENDNSQPVAGCIFPHKHVFLPNMFFPTHSFLCSNCVLAGKRQFATSCGVYLSTQTCFLTKHVFSNPFVPLFQLCLCWKTTIRNQWRGVFFPHNHVFSPNVCFPNHSLFCSNCVSAGKR